MAAAPVTPMSPRRLRRGVRYELKMSEDQHLQIVVETDSRSVVITLHGELDLASAADVSQAIADAGASGAAVVIVDLRGLEFMDSAGISVLVRGHEAARGAGHQFAIVKGTPQVDRLLNLTGLDDQLTLVDDPAELLQRD
jgi:anti-sigma B factor antagonist